MAAMKKNKIRSLAKILIPLGIFLLSFWLRIDKYDVYPQLGATHDEFAFGFLGVNLFQNGKLSSWSNIPLYTDKYFLKANNTQYTIVKTYFDHPPLFGLLVGSFSLLKGEKKLTDVKLSTIRFPAVLLSSFSVVLLYYLVRSLYNSRIALLSSLIYATVPTFVVSGRMALAENLLIPFSLLALLLFQKLKKTKKIKYAYLLGVITGLAFLTKVVGIFILLAVFLLLLPIKNSQKFLIPLIIIFILIAGIYPFYGLLINKDLFPQIISFQGGREVGMFSFFNLFLTPSIVNKVIIDGWVYWGWFSIFILLLNFRENKEIGTIFLSYLFIFLITVNQKDLHGWYNYPFYPFLAVAGGKLISEFFKNNSPLKIIFFITAGISVIDSTYFNFFGYSQIQFRMLIFLFFLSFLLGLSKIRKLKIISQKLFILFIIIIFILNIISVFNFIHPA